MLRRKISKAIRKSISLQASGVGRSRSNSPGGRRIVRFGLDPVRASLLARLEADSVLRMTAIFGLLWKRWSPSAVLQYCLANKLREKADLNGSPEYRLIWKTWDMPSGQRICALRASGRRTSGKGFTGWPTPQDSRRDDAREHEADHTTIHTTEQRGADGGLADADSADATATGLYLRERRPQQTDALSPWRKRVWRAGRLRQRATTRTERAT